jgi:hypothetical protein
MGNGFSETKNEFKGNILPISLEVSPKLQISNLFIEDLKLLTAIVA